MAPVPEAEVTAIKTGVKEARRTVDLEIETYATNGNTSETGISANFQSDFEIPIYNRWSYGKVTNKTDHFGKTEQRIKVKRNAKIFELWLACHTQEAIAESVGVHKDTVSEITDDCRKKFCETESDKSAMNHTSDFNIPIYNVWKQQTKSKLLEKLFSDPVLSTDFVDKPVINAPRQ